MKLAIIPARGGSKRIPRKNIRDFLGKPIIAYSIAAAIESKLFDYIIVSTDDEEIAGVARAAGADGVTVTRSEDLAATVQQAVRNRRPCVIDLHVDAEVRPPSTGTWQLPPTPFKEPAFGKPYIA